MKIKATVDKANEALAKIQQAGSLSMTDNKGSFSVKGVVGRFSYDSEAEELTVVIDDKPWLVSQDYVESEIRNFFKN
jgi:hypothetical protein